MQSAPCGIRSWLCAVLDLFCWIESAVWQYEKESVASSATWIWQGFASIWYDWKPRKKSCHKTWILYSYPLPHFQNNSIIVRWPMASQIGKTWQKSEEWRCEKVFNQSTPVECVCVFIVWRWGGGGGCDLNLVEELWRMWNMLLMADDDIKVVSDASEKGTTQGICRFISCVIAP